MSRWDSISRQLGECPTPRDHRETWGAPSLSSKLGLRFANQVAVNVYVVEDIKT